MKNTVTFLFILICSLSYSFGQNEDRDAEMDSVETQTPKRAFRLPYDYNLQDQLVSQYKNNGAMVRTFDDRYEGIKGSPFLLNDFLPGVLIHTSGQSYDNLTIRYNLMEQEVEYKTIADNKTLVIDAKDLALIILKDRKSNQDFVFEQKGLTMQKGRAPEYPHFITLYDKGSTLLVQPEKTFSEADYQGAYSADQTYDEYKTQFVYFLRPNNQEDFIRVKLSNNSFTKALADHKNEVKAFLKKELMDIDIEGEAVKLLEYYDGL